MRIPTDCQEPVEQQPDWTWRQDISQKATRIAMTVGLLASLGSILVAEQILPDYMFPVIKDAGRMSIAVYGKKPELIEELRSEGWEVFMFGSLPGGLNFGVWDRQLPNGQKERFVVFAGTAGLADGTTDLGQIVTGPVPNRQYADALILARSFVEQADRDPNLTVRFSGHSLGGGIAQYVGAEFGVQAITFNAAPIQEATVMARLMTFWRQKNRPAQQRVARDNVYNLRLRGDLVSSAVSTMNSLRVPAADAWQSGGTIVQRVTKGVCRMKAQIVILLIVVFPAALAWQQIVHASQDRPRSA